MTGAAIVLVTTSFPIAGDGSEAAGSFVSDLAEELARHVPVRVVAPGRTSGRERWAANVEMFRYSAPAKPLSILKPWHLDDLADIARVMRAGERATRDAVLAGPAAHILALWALPSGEWARRASRATGVPYSVWTLGSDIWTLGRIPLIRSSLRRVLRNARHCYSDGLKLAEDTRHIARRDVEFLPSTRRIELENACAPAAQPPYRLLFLGRWHPNKGIDLLLDALAMLDDDDWSRIRCVEIQGGGPLEPMVRERVAQLEREGRPVVAGRFLAKAEAEAAIARADWVLIPSRIESIPVVFSDAMKIGRPIICTPVGDLPRLVTEFAVGMCSSTVAPDAMAAAIRKSLLSSADGFAPGVEAAANAFSLERTTARRLLEATDDMRGRSPGRRPGEPTGL